jgi:hypothetical protein
VTEFVDESGDQVLKFVSAARNLSRLGELTDEVLAIAKSGAWRRYRSAVGVDEWRECELDYFLIACDLSHDDVGRIVAYTREGASLASMMDREANGERRRPLEEASAAWHAPTPETLIERAQRLGWTRSSVSPALRAAPLPPRARARQVHGMTMDEHAQRTREQRLPTSRRHELDGLVARLRAELSDDLERLYVIDQLRETTTEPRGRPQVSEQDQRQWRADAERLDWDTDQLAKEWGVHRTTASRRVRRLLP